MASSVSAKLMKQTTFRWTRYEQIWSSDPSCSLSVGLVCSAAWKHSVPFWSKEGDSNQLKEALCFGLESKMGSLAETNGKLLNNYQKHFVAKEFFSIPAENQSDGKLYIINAVIHKEGFWCFVFVCIGRKSSPRPGLLLPRGFCWFIYSLYIPHFNWSKITWCPLTLSRYLYKAQSSLYHTLSWGRVVAGVHRLNPSEVLIFCAVKWNPTLPFVESVELVDDLCFYQPAGRLALRSITVPARGFHLRHCVTARLQVMKVLCVPCPLSDRSHSGSLLFNARVLDVTFLETIVFCYCLCRGEWQSLWRVGATKTRFLSLYVL